MKKMESGKAGENTMKGVLLEGQEQTAKGCFKKAPSPSEREEKAERNPGECDGQSGRCKSVPEINRSAPQLGGGRHGAGVEASLGPPKTRLCSKGARGRKGIKRGKNQKDGVSLETSVLSFKRQGIFCRRTSSHHTAEDGKGLRKQKKSPDRRGAHRGLEGSPQKEGGMIE